MGTPMKFAYWGEGFAFIGIYLFLVGFPCIMTAILGTKLIDHIGQWPMRSGRTQLWIGAALIAVEVISFGMFAVFFHIFS